MRRRKDLDYHKYVKDKKLPILTLDARWHELFPDERKSYRIKQLEQKVNQLLKKQGKLVNDIKDMKNLKKSLVSDIVVNMDINNNHLGKSKEKKLEQNKRYIHELNDKIDKASDMLSELPYKIKEANEELLVESIQCCYERILDNVDKANEITDWIKNIREELKLKILERHDMKATNISIYTYLHAILGSEVMDVFDDKHNIKKEDDENP